jgi:hypothetical protein
MSGPNPSVHEIVGRYLDGSSEDFGGLFNEAEKCCCTKDDLAPCGEMRGNCEAGFLVTTDEAEKLGLPVEDGDLPFWITSVSPKTLSP